MRTVGGQITLTAQGLGGHSSTWRPDMPEIAHRRGFLYMHTDKCCYVLESVCEQRHRASLKS